MITVLFALFAIAVVGYLIVQGLRGSTNQRPGTSDSGGWAGDSTSYASSSDGYGDSSCSSDSSSDSGGDCGGGDGGGGD